MCDHNYNCVRILLLTNDLLFKGAYPCLQFDFALERKSCQFFLQFYLPSILIVILSWLAFWIDLETSTPSRLLTGIFSLIALILLNGVATYTSVATQYKTSFSCWMVASYVLVFGTLVEFAVVNILSKSSGAAHGFEYLKAPFAGSEKANEAVREQEILDKTLPIQ